MRQNPRRSVQEGDTFWTHHDIQHPPRGVWGSSSVTSRLTSPERAKHRSRKARSSPAGVGKTVKQSRPVLPPSQLPERKKSLLFSQCSRFCLCGQGTADLKYDRKTVGEQLTLTGRPAWAGHGHALPADNLRAFTQNRTANNTLSYSPPRSPRPKRRAWGPNVQWFTKSSLWWILRKTRTRCWLFR